MTVRRLSLAGHDCLAPHYETAFVLYSEMAKSTGVELRIAKARGGVVTAQDLEPLVNRRTKLVSVAWVSHQNGFRHDLRPIADLAHAHGAFFYTDGIQGAGMFPIDVKAAGVDARCVGTDKWLLGAYGVAVALAHQLQKGLRTLAST